MCFETLVWKQVIHLVGQSSKFLKKCIRCKKISVFGVVLGTLVVVEVVVFSAIKVYCCNVLLPKQKHRDTRLL